MRRTAIGRCNAVLTLAVLLAAAPAREADSQSITVRFRGTQVGPALTIDETATGQSYEQRSVCLTRGGQAVDLLLAVRGNAEHAERWGWAQLSHEVTLRERHPGTHGPGGIRESRGNDPIASLAVFATPRRDGSSYGVGTTTDWEDGCYYLQLWGYAGGEARVYTGIMIPVAGGDWLEPDQP